MNWLALCTRLMATDRYLISLASSCIGSHRGEPGIEAQPSAPCGLPGGVPWTERPDRSTPSTPVHDRDGALPSDLQLAARRHVAVMARAAARGSGMGAPKLVLRKTGHVHGTSPVLLPRQTSALASARVFFCVLTRGKLRFANLHYTEANPPPRPRRAPSLN